MKKLSMSAGSVGSVGDGESGLNVGPPARLASTQLTTSFRAKPAPTLRREQARRVVAIAVAAKGARIPNSCLMVFDDKKGFGSAKGSPLGICSLHQMIAAVIHEIPIRKRNLGLVMIVGCRVRFEKGVRIFVADNASVVIVWRRRL